MANNLKSISCLGYRSFSIEQKLNLAIPNGKRGSGLTILIGPNGGGKSTIIECFAKLTAGTSVTFTEGKRNKDAGDRVDLKAFNEKDELYHISTVDSGGSETKIRVNGFEPKVYYLPSRRVFNPYFGKSKWGRTQFVKSPESKNFRAQSMNNFTYRLFTALDNKTEFNKLFWRVLGQEIEWTIDENDSNQHYLKVIKQGGAIHNSDGMGEGIVSLLFLCDAIYDSTGDDVVVIDEPELSLHPQLQKRFLNELLEYAKDKQIVIATHSAIFTSIESAINGGVIARVFEDEYGSIISEIDQNCRSYFESFTLDLHNPHVVGNEAIISLFEDDGLILTEGQEDVLLFPIILNQLGIPKKSLFMDLVLVVPVKYQKLHIYLSNWAFTK